jgi:hypothetical protein
MVSGYSLISLCIVKNVNNQYKYEQRSGSWSLSIAEGAEDIWESGSLLSLRDKNSWPKRKQKRREQIGLRV